MNNPFLCAVAAGVDPKTRTVEITLDNGNVYRCSLADVSDRLRLVDASLLTDWEWIGPKAGMHWPAVDEDLSIEYLVANGVLCNQTVGASSESVQVA
ncbi:MAG: DUF2442 domain-containing protein [candidate division KSB1 bacterium]|nr:DUF2442 domain-containing protein [candidate division KSB1 bacterium]MDZ7368405.1 DUF2442 domain-containing protein [candidate division KSB1 bacterium]MDZ7406019.1 DUF2442 domain-containing protein [candidate division KSB1 bacterium]